MVPRPALLLALSLAACATSTDTDTSGDSGTPADGTPVVPWYADGAPAVAAPVIPWEAGAVPVEAPNFTCRPGWTSTTLDNGGTICEPWPTGTREVCASPTAMQLPGTSGCVEVGEACPAGDWPEALPASGVWYVAPGGTGDGTSAETPMGSVAAAVAAAGPGDTVALAKGTYDEAVTVTGQVTIRGACAAETKLTSSTITEFDAVVTEDGGDLTLRDVQVSDSTGMGLAGYGGTVNLDGVAFIADTVYNVFLSEVATTATDVLSTDGVESPTDQAHGYGMAAIGGTLDLSHTSILRSTALGLKLENITATIDDLAIVDVTPRVSDLGLGWGLACQKVTVADIEGLVVENTISSGVEIRDDSQVTLRDAVVRHVQPGADIGLYGYAISASDYAVLVGERLYVHDYGTSGFFLYTDVDTDYTVDVTLSDVVFTGGAHAWGQSTGGFGLLVNGEGVVSMTRAVITDNEAEGIVFTKGATATLSDVRVERSGALGDAGAGITLHNPSTVLTRAILADNVGFGLYVDTLASVTASDVEVSASGAEPTAFGSGGVVVTGAGDVSLSRFRVHDVGYVGMQLDTSTSVVIADIDVHDVSPDVDGQLGFGMALTGNGSAQADRLDIGQVSLAGFNAVGSVTVNDLHVSGVISGEDGGSLGLGVFLEDGDVTGARWLVEDSQNAGFGLTRSDAVVSDVRIDGVTPRSCAATTCTDDAGSPGVFVDASSNLELNTFMVGGTEGVGLQTAGDLTVNDGYVLDAAYGTEASGSGRIFRARVDVTGADAASPDAPQPVPTLLY